MRKLRESYHSMIADVLLDVESGLMSSQEALAQLKANGLDTAEDAPEMDVLRHAEDQYYDDAFDDYPDEFEGPDPIMESTLGSVYDVLAQVEAGDITSVDALRTLSDVGLHADTNPGGSNIRTPIDDYSDGARQPSMQFEKRAVMESDHSRMAQAVQDLKQAVFVGALSYEEAVEDLRDQFGSVDPKTEQELANAANQHDMMEYSRDSERRFGRFRDGLD